MTRAALVVLVGLAVAAPLAAQCPDGTPPPCGRAPLDSNRIAVLPLRVVSADTLLGEGLAELLTAEFTGEGGPRGAPMGNVLRAWRRAGGGLRAGLTRQAAMAVAREVGAGLLVEGTVVGLGTRISVTASVVRVSTGASRRIGPVSGSGDSIEAVLRQLTTGLLAATGGETRAAGSRLTDSPRALRSYVEGLALWRRRQYQRAVVALEAALAEDSTFAGAAYARLMAGRYLNQDARRWSALAWRYQDNLSSPDRVVLRAVLGARHPAPRTLDERVADFEEAVRLAPLSPEVHYELGDLLLHFGRAAGFPGSEARAQALFERSLALDSQAVVLNHLFWAAESRGDTAQLRRVWDAYGAFLGPNMDLTLGWFVGGLTGDPHILEIARGGPRAGWIHTYEAGAAGVPGAILDEMFARSERQGSADPRTWLAYMHSAMVQGRPGAAVRAAEATELEGSATARDALLIIGAIASDGDTVAAAAAARRLARTADPTDSAQARAACARALWELDRGRAAEWDDALLRAHGQLNCAVILDVVRAWRAGADDVDARVVAAESLVRARLGPNEYAGFENIVLSRVWEARGRTTAALTAARRFHRGYSPTTLAAATSARAEGLLAALVGDTAGAVRAYRYYLTLRRDAEPVLQPQRDSVRAELARLEGRP